ncbi:MAG: hypothetical protein JSS27_11480 [Planctomycetes bacterium]|nr:hypothetical protein [Planctomycetota bacterium]
MDKTEVSAHLAEVKLQLAAKYDGMARRSTSLPRQRKYINQADNFRTQAQQLSRQKPR